MAIPDFPRGIASQWYEALFEEDCLRVMRLLERDRSLLRVGWKSDPSREVEGSPGNHWEPRTRRPWMGRTALHVGSRRGCVKLIKQALTLCNIEDMTRMLSKLDDKQEDVKYVLTPASRPVSVEDKGTVTSSRGSRENTAAAGQFDNGDSVEGGDRKEIIIIGSPQADSVSEGDDQPVWKIAQAAEKTWPDRLPPQTTVSTTSRKVDNNRIQETLAHWKEQVERSKAKRGQPVNARWKRMFTKWKDSNLQERARGSDTPKHPLLTESGRDLYGSNLERTFRDSFSREELRDLLLSKDGEYELDALAMATLNGNNDLIVLLVYAIGECENPPYNIIRSIFSPQALNDDDKACRHNRARLRVATNEIIETYHSSSRFQAHMKEFSIHRDFNFLSPKEYLFHFTWTSRFGQHDGLEMFELDLRDTLRAKLFQVGLYRFVLELQDGQGRPPMHVALDERTVIMLFDQVIDSEAKGIILKHFTVSDGAGRWPLHRAAATGYVDAVEQITFRCMFFEGRGICSKEWEPSVPTWRDDHGGPLFDVEKLSYANGFRFGSPLLTPLHAAIIHKRNDCAKLLMESSDQDEDDTLYSYVDTDEYEPTRAEVPSVLDNMELVCLVGDNLELVDHMLKKGYLKKAQKWSLRAQRGTYLLLALHFIAASGNYKMLERFIDDPLCEPFSEDYEGNTPLHYALHKETRFKTEFQTHLLDYVGCQHLLSRDQRKVQKKALDHNILAERQGCANLLLQAGCDIFKGNKEKRTPYPRGSLSENGMFLSWWHEKQAKEFAATQNNFNIASNAILVTATLVATASYLGPVQPPLGLGVTGSTIDQIQYGNVWVATFVFCDTLSFYLATVAIILSLIPSLPIPQQAMADEIRRTKVMMILAVSVLFPSIICVLLAFVSSSLAVVSANILSQTGGKLTIATLCFGGPLILVVFLLCLIRLLGISFPQSRAIRHMYKLTSF